MTLTQAIIPAAGLGTRFLPWTKVVPKELLPLGNTPIIASIVDEVLDAGIREICFVLRPGKEIIAEYFQKNDSLEKELKKRGKEHSMSELLRYNEVDFHTVYQHEQLGDGHAILQARSWVKSPGVAVLFGDDLFLGSDPGITQLKHAASRILEHKFALMALENISADQVHQYGIVDVKEENEHNPRLKKLSSMVEKPAPQEAPSTLCIVGRYIIPQIIFDVLESMPAEPGNELRLIDALITKLSDIPMYGYECEGKRIDTGTPEGYKEALNSVNEKTPVSSHA